MMWGNIEDVKETSLDRQTSLLTTTMSLRLPKMWNVQQEPHIGIKNICVQQQATCASPSHTATQSLSIRWVWVIQSPVLWLVVVTSVTYRAPAIPHCPLYIAFPLPVAILNHRVTGKLIENLLVYFSWNFSSVALEYRSHPPRPKHEKKTATYSRHMRFILHSVIQCNQHEAQVEKWNTSRFF